MSVNIGGITFDRVRYDRDGDVLYLHVGDPATAVDFDASPEGHALRCAPPGAWWGCRSVKRARNAWAVQPHGARRTVLTTDAEAEVTGGRLGRLLEPVMGALTRRLRSTPRCLAAFKYLVEHGTPYAGRHATSPPVRAGCSPAGLTARRQTAFA